MASRNPAPGALSTSTLWPLGTCSVCAVACDSCQPHVAWELLEGGKYERRPESVVLSDLSLYT